MTPRPRRVRTALVGTHGFGSVHLANLRRLAERVELVAAADPMPTQPGTLPDETRVFASLTELLEQVDDLDAVIVATPLHTHASLAHEVVHRGIDLYLEKPPVVSLADFRSLEDAARVSGAAVQVGFQSLGSHALDLFDRDEFELGSLQAVGATGAWLRTDAYWRRSRWAGRRTLDGLDVVDGVSTNPLAHAVATALRIGGATRVEHVGHVDADLYHANPIDGDDTSVLRITTTRGLTVTAALTLCAPEETLPEVIVRGTRETARFSYVDDVVVVGGARRGHGRTDLFENLLDHRASGVALLAPLAATGAFAVVTDAIRRTEPQDVDPAAVEWRGVNGDRHPVIVDIGQWLERAVDAEATFAELRAPWAVALDDVPLAELAQAGAPVGVVCSGRTVTATSAPRPYLHPLLTPRGVVVTAHHPLDHDWHLGLGFAVQHVDGVNFWGGRTYVRGEGYRWRADHGRIECVATRTFADRVDLDLRWRGPDGSTVLEEERRMRWARAGSESYVLDIDISLRPAAHRTVTFGSPGSNGRVGGGYGGLTWRLPEGVGVEVRTLLASGEEAVHGTVAPWVAWSTSLADGDVTIALAASDERTAQDPWFVRVAAYPGIGSAIAWEREVTATRAEPLVRSYRALLADGRLDDRTVAARLERS